MTNFFGDDTELRDIQLSNREHFIIEIQEAVEGVFIAWHSILGHSRKVSIREAKKAERRIIKKMIEDLSSGTWRYPGKYPSVVEYLKSLKNGVWKYRPK